MPICSAHPRAREDPGFFGGFGRRRGNLIGDGCKGALKRVTTIPLFGGQNMIFENLTINRVVVHEVFQRNEDKSINSPVFSSNLENLSDQALGAFRLRMNDALSGQSQSLQMYIAKHGVGSLLYLAEGLASKSDDLFLDGSKQIAIKLAEAQLSRRIPGGMVVVFDGCVGSPPVPFIGIIKAETQAGFRRSKDGEKTIVEFLQNIFLTPATRLYKIGLLLLDDLSKPPPEGRRVVVFDSNISLNNREAAAAYFYDGFLGCALPSDGPYETSKFFDLTKEFVKRSDLYGDKKRNIMDSLYVFIRDEQSPTFTYDQFATRYLPIDLQDSYSGYMDTKNSRETPW